MCISLLGELNLFKLCSRCTDVMFFSCIYPDVFVLLKVLRRSLRWVDYYYFLFSPFSRWWKECLCVCKRGRGDRERVKYSAWHFILMQMRAAWEGFIQENSDGKECVLGAAPWPDSKTTSMQRYGEGRRRITVLGFVEFIVQNKRD